MEDPGGPPKGGGLLGNTGLRPHPAPAWQAVIDYLAERRAFLGDVEHEALLPFRRSSGVIDYWPDAMLGKLKAEIQRLSGVRFSFKNFRLTFAQNAKDLGADPTFMLRCTVGP